MGMCYIEIDRKPSELLYEDVRDGKGNFIETAYHNKERVKSVWEQMAKNIARTVREILIQKPELIPVFCEIYESQQREIPDVIKERLREES